jgi:hypothetical protein
MVFKSVVMPDRGTSGKASIVAAPHGFSDKSLVKPGAQQQQRVAAAGAGAGQPLDIKAIKLTRAWAVAQSPAKSI